MAGHNKYRIPINGVLIASLLSGCGLQVPVKSEIRSDEPHGPTYSQQGYYEDGIVSHIACELALGITQIQQFELPWVNKWGTSVTLTITAQDQSGISPAISTFDPFENLIKTFPTGGPVTIARSFGVAAGVSGAATATRTETIQFTYLNSDLLMFGRNHPSCLSDFITGAQIDGDLHIRQFLFDKAMIARYGNASLFDQRSEGFTKIATKDKPLNPWKWAVFNTFTEEITFVAAYGGSFTPTWKLFPVSGNTSGALLAAERTSTNDLVITVGPLGSLPSSTAPLSLSAEAQNQHNAHVQANAIATSIQGQQHN
jgi:hypothetical protein